VLRQGLAEDGLTVDVVCPGPEGNGQVPALDYDAVILDVVRPRDAGLVLVEGWRQAGLQRPVLALTAPGDGDARVPGLRALADDLLTKPFELDELLARLRALVRRHGRVEDAALCGTP
jgi:DNA-binding response OmpR family regulator